MHFRRNKLEFVDKILFIQKIIDDLVTQAAVITWLWLQITK